MNPLYRGDTRTLKVTLEEVGLSVSTDIVLALDAVTYADADDALSFVDAPETVTFTDQTEDIQ